MVYYGPGLGGKTTSLQFIHQNAPPESRGELVSLATPVDRTLYFDFLPLRGARVRDHHLRLQLFTVPGQVYFNATRKLVLTGADGLVFVADSQRERHDANLESYENLEQNLHDQGRELSTLPHVLQLNKRDLPNILPPDEMERTLNLYGAPAFPTCATRGEGVFDSLDAVVSAVIADLERRRVFGEPSVPPPRVSFGRAEEAFEEQIGRASEQIWRDTVERALATRMGASSVPAAAPVGAATLPGATGGPAPLEDVRMRPSSAPPPAAAPVVSDASGGASVAGMFGDDAAVARAVEADLGAGRFPQAIARIDGLVVRRLEAIAREADMDDADLAVLALAAGIEAPRWLALRRLVRRARAGDLIEAREAVWAWALALELCTRAE